MTRKKIYLGFIIISGLYLFVHHFVMNDNLGYEGIKNSLSEAKEHIWHVAPIVVLFLVLLAKDLRDRYNKLGPYANKENDSPGN